TFKNSEKFREHYVTTLVETLRSVLSAKGILKFYSHFWIGRFKEQTSEFTEKTRAFNVEIQSAEQASMYYEKTLKNYEDIDGDILRIYLAKMFDMHRLEEQIGQDSGSYLADVEMGGVYTRTYVFICKRKILNTQAYTFSLNCAYRPENQAEPESPY